MVTPVFLSLCVSGRNGSEWLVGYGMDREEGGREREVSGVENGLRYGWQIV